MRALLRLVVVFVLLIAIAAGALAVFVWQDMPGGPEQAGTLSEVTVPAAVHAQRAASERAAAAAIGGPGEGRILFGDLHVHTTFSFDAFTLGLPTFGGNGMHPVEDACDFARFCSQLDFWSINDHAESLTPRHWSMTRDAIRNCNARAGDPADPDTVAFLGWEWSQGATTPEAHYGHKNVVLYETADDKTPARPIGAGGAVAEALRARLPPLGDRLAFTYQDFDNRALAQDYWYKIEALNQTPICPDGVGVRELPADCSEFATDPAELFAKLRQWEVDALVIPHGNTWGFYSPLGTSWDKQLTLKQHDPDLQRLIEIHSGHGNSEPYRSWREIEYDSEGNEHCPAPKDGYLPCCHQAGEIIRERCPEPASAECDARVRQARADYLEAGVAGHLVVGGTQATDWLNCGQCPDCEIPAFGYRPRGSTQYAMALSNPAETGADGRPLRFHFGFIGSSDVHRARPGTGFKELARVHNTEASHANAFVRTYIANAAKIAEPLPDSQPRDLEALGDRFSPLQLLDVERQASFFTTGGLVAVHAGARDRAAVWQALKDRNTYATTGSRILLWFDLVNGPAGASVPMGSQAELTEAPRFRVRAAGAEKQLPGCPQHSVDALGAEGVERLCGGECFNPSGERERIARIEVARIRPRTDMGQPMEELIDDPWKTFQCADDANGCAAEFDDPDYPASGREALYYVRALQVPTPAVNGGGLRCELDEAGQCVKVNPCYGDYRTGATDDCLAPIHERAVSSPIYVLPPIAAAPAGAAPAPVESLP